MSTARGWIAPAVASVLLVGLLAGPSQAARERSAAASASQAAPLPPTEELPLEGTRWRVRDYLFRGVLRSSGPEVAAWMTLRAGRLEGSGGCTRLRGRYGVMGAALAVAPQATRQGGCAEQTTIVQLGMLDGLRDAATYEIVPSTEAFGEQLLLRDAAGQLMLAFVPDDIALLEPGEWLLEAYSVAGERDDADPSQPAVLAFRPARRSAARRDSTGEAVGSSGCNGFLGPYSRHADVLSFGEFERTDAPCSTALSAQQAAIEAVLDSTSLNLDLPPDRLILVSADSGDSLEFVNAVPLEGSTWLLARLPGYEPADGPVTLRLLDGIVSGEGPCGSYGGRYQTDGLFIHFSELGGAQLATCPEQRRERDLLAALERTVVLERTALRGRGQPYLRLLDAKGRVQASFRPAAGP